MVAQDIDRDVIMPGIIQQIIEDFPIKIHRQLECLKKNSIEKEE